MSQESAVAELATGSTFEETARLVLAYLADGMPMGSWAVTRVENGKQTTLMLGENERLDQTVGGSCRWEDTFCVNMIEGRAPRVAPDVQSIPALRDARRDYGVEIGSYAGVPIVEPDGELFGVLCGIDTDTRDPAFEERLPLLETFSALLNVALAAERQRDHAARVAEAAITRAETDGLTGLYNRHGWERHLAAEQARYRRLGDPTVVVIVDVDGLKEINDEHGHMAGDRHLKAVAGALRDTFRKRDPIARIGGDEFGVIITDCSVGMARRRAAALVQRLEALEVSASIGWAPATVPDGIAAAANTADRRMYACKAKRKAGSAR